MNEKEIIRYLYDEGYIDFTRDENEELTLHANTTGKGLIEIFRAGYGKSQKELAEAKDNHSLTKEGSGDTAVSEKSLKAFGDNHSPRENKEFKSLRAEIGIKPEDTHAKDNYMLFAPNDEPIAKTNDIVKDKKGCGKFLGWLKGNIKLVCGEYDVLCPKCEERIESPDYPESQEEWEEREVGK